VFYLMVAKPALQWSRAISRRAARVRAPRNSWGIPPADLWKIFPGGGGRRRLRVLGRAPGCARECRGRDSRL